MYTADDMDRAHRADAGRRKADFAGHVRRLVEVHGIAPARARRAASIRLAIRDGAYETPEKLDAAMDELLAAVDRTMEVRPRPEAVIVHLDDADRELHDLLDNVAEEERRAERRRDAAKFGEDFD